MITGIGLDVVELDRIASLDAKSPKFRARILTEKELEIYESYHGHRQVEFLAGRFAGKEAFAKALGTGIGEKCNFIHIEILPNPEGKPELAFKGTVANGFISITHTKNIAAAQVILQA
ncbi:holo-ACP synthase [Sporosarcina pasteurii]|uniref:Holo-[acyl-carrier-protein] synthase n=1 Tax=Sporosarcina pasteurii TaxID=1474 RepID=A0A380CHR2_SPOPA|nr:holo-ACP synthase [Sporosarcina pasteurii]MDS9472177.1 holo-ACP synthase [Sporosarcina pasteurii]QBQ06888.1 holo-[acyl-carrier-protein] synthase [Sporosarcina pasteurii]SUJ20219.1 Holo-[acyl-carrier-protein] synthase [Sporosarcina pasteurii]